MASSPFFSNFFAGNDTPYNNSNTLMSVGLGLLSGKTANEQVGNAASNFVNNRQMGKTFNKTIELLKKQNPELAEAVESGIISPLDAYKTHVQSQAPMKPLEVNGRLVDPKTFQVLADFSNKPEGAQPTALMRELEAAGLQPGTPEFQQAILANNRPKGMMIESDGAGGFRMVQGADVSGGANLNVEQGKNTGFLMRAADSNKTIDQVGATEGTSLFNKLARKTPLGLGNYALSDDAQKLEQSKRDFINAVLRQESGAVISEEEFANADQQYFPQPGDSEAVILQKAQNRENAIAGFRIRSGPGAASVGQMQAQPPQAGGVVDYTDYFK